MSSIARKAIQGRATSTARVRSDRTEDTAVDPTDGAGGLAARSIISHPPQDGECRAGHRLGIDAPTALVPDSTRRYLVLNGTAVKIFSPSAQRRRTLLDQF
jgi:hypothetical protein